MKQLINALTTLFSQKFPEWAKQVIQQRQGDTNAVPFTEEDATKINELTKSLLWLLKDTVEHPNKADDGRSASLEALQILQQIRELLPKDRNQNQQQNQQQQQQSPKDQPQNQPQDKSDQKDQQQEQEPEKSEQQEQKPEEKKPQAKSAEQEVPKDVQEALRRAIEREKEHEADKKLRMRRFPMAPSARDW